MSDSDKEGKAEFDADFSPRNPQNRQAAKDHGLRWSERRKAYVDDDGCPVRDHFGQSL